MEQLGLDNMKSLKNKGFLILVDDMGSGVTSSRDLLNYPVDIVKADNRKPSMLAHLPNGSGMLRISGMAKILENYGFVKLRKLEKEISGRVTNCGMETFTL